MPEEQPMERDRRRQRKRADAPTKYERDKAERQQWERGNPGKLYRGSSTIGGTEEYGRHGRAVPVADVLDFTKLSKLSPVQARKRIDDLQRDEDFMARYERGEPKAVKRMTILHEIAYQ